MQRSRVTDETFVAVYENLTFAEAAVADLKRAGVPEIGITLHPGTAGNAGNAGTGGTAGDPAPEGGLWRSLFGGEPGPAAPTSGNFAPGGSTVVTVRTPEALVGRVMEILESHEPIDLRERLEGQGAAVPVSAPRRPPVATMPVPRGVPEPEG